jgi:hypothetical protein
MTKESDRVGLIPIHPINTKSIHDAMDFTPLKVIASPGNFRPGTGAGCAGGKEQ